MQVDLWVDLRNSKTDGTTLTMIFINELSVQVVEIETSRPSIPGGGGSTDLVVGTTG
jgi:hypothetical protein